ncbi:MAG: hypothetical protein JXM70_16715, partial [Pirellulales bacterium]|nr:hypothetical protein [Pirellulales bacterium]
QQAGSQQHGSQQHGLQQARSLAKSRFSGPQQGSQQGSQQESQQAGSQQAGSQAFSQAGSQQAGAHAGWQHRPNNKPAWTLEAVIRMLRAATIITGRRIRRFIGGTPLVEPKGCDTRCV